MIHRFLRLGAAVFAGIALQAQTPPSETILVSLIDRPVGKETVTTTTANGNTTYASELDLTERGGRLQVSSTLTLGADLTPSEFTVKGKSYRFVNVDTAVKVAGGMATVTNLGETKTFEAPRRFFTAQSYSPLSTRAQLIRYWYRVGSPPAIPVLPGEPTRDVRIERRGIDTITVNGKPQQLRRFSIDGI